MSATGRAGIAGLPARRARHGRAGAWILLLLALPVVLVACSEHRPTGDRHAVTVTLRPDGCVAEPGSAPAGPVTFRIRNDGAAEVDELEVLRGDRVLGERERLTPGRSADLSLELSAGGYTLRCPGATDQDTAFTVTTATSSSVRADPGVDADLRSAVEGYRTYVRGETAALATATRVFAAAVEAGDVGRAKRLYSPTRAHYERIEPVAETFGELDAAVDAREDDVDDPAAWRGFHRIERALWQQGSTAGMAPVARQLVSDVDRLRALVDTADYQPAQLANGASELLDEVATSKITGEEERYSRTDVDDIAANVAGARAAFDLLEPALKRLDPDLAGTLGTRFAAVQGRLERLRDGAGYLPYPRLSAADVRDVTAVVDALAEPLSQVAARITGR